MNFEFCVFTAPMTIYDAMLDAVFFARCPIPKIDLTSVGATWLPDSEVSSLSSEWINRSVFEAHVLRCMIVDWSQAVSGVLAVHFP